MAESFFFEGPAGVYDVCLAKIFPVNYSEGDICKDGEHQLKPKLPVDCGH